MSIFFKRYTRRRKRLPLLSPMTRRSVRDHRLCIGICFLPSVEIPGLGSDSLKPNQILVGIIVMLIGVFSLLRIYISFNFGMLLILVIGLALLLLYQQKKTVWALFAGGYMTFFGLMQLLTWVGFGPGVHTIAGMFFIVPGVIFMTLYFDKNKRGLLIPSCILLWFGLYFVLIRVPVFGMRSSFGMAVICLGCSLCTAYGIGRSHLSRWVRNLGVFLLVAGGLLLGGFIRFVGGVSKILSYALIAVGVLIVAKSFMNKPRN